MFHPSAPSLVDMAKMLEHLLYALPLYLHTPPPSCSFCCLALLSLPNSYPIGQAKLSTTGSHTLCSWKDGLMPHI